MISRPRAGKGFREGMSFILLIVGTMLALDGLCWFLATRLTRPGIWRAIILAFVAAQALGLLAFIVGRFAGLGMDRALGKLVTSGIFIWHFLGLTMVVVMWLVGLPALLRKRSPAKPPTDGAWTRREFLSTAAAALPPIFTLGLTGVALTQLDDFRVRRLALPIPNLPPPLNGLTIAHVSDMHVGRFTSGRVLGQMVEAVNALRADLVLLTGDLINDALADLPTALATVRAMEGRFGLWSIEGNHDLIEDASEFRRRAKASPVPFLLDETATVAVRGVPVQLLGIRWTRARGQARDAAIGDAVRSLLLKRDPEAFPILLAHHPHAFDAAAEAGVPITLAGHTHGGQLMLNEALGFGPAMFRYWSGVYEKGASRLVVSNGVGNWFPLRTQAPAEIIHLTLRAA